MVVMDTSRDDGFGSVAAGSGDNSVNSNNGGGSVDINNNNSMAMSNSSGASFSSFGNAGSGESRGVDPSVGDEGGASDRSFEPSVSNDSGASDRSLGSSVSNTSSTNEVTDESTGGAISGTTGGIFNGAPNEVTGGVFNGTSNGIIGGAGGEAFNGVLNGSASGGAAIFSNPATPMEVGGSEVAFGQQKKKKIGLIVGIVIAAICVVVGIMLFLTVGLSALDPKTGDNIKAKNYQEAFNIYANYFLFGERSKMAVDWEAARADDFVSYFRKVVDNPFGVEGADGAQASPSSIIAKMNEYFSVFQKMYTEQENNTNAIAYVDEYGRTLKLVFLNYDTGLPTRESVLASYLEGGRKVADGMIQDIAKKYETVGVLFGDDINNLVSRYGESQLALIEEYNKMGCVSGGGIDYNCVSSNDNEVSRRYSLDSSETLDEYLSDITGSYNDLRRKLSIIGDGINTEWGTSPNGEGEMNS